VLLVPTIAYGKNSPRTILVLDQSAPLSPFGERFRGSLNGKLNERPEAPVAVFAETLDAGRFPGEGQEEARDVFLRSKYSDVRLGAIVTVGAEALRAALRLRLAAQPDVPIVFLDFNTASRAILAPNATGIIAPLSMSSIVSAVLAVAPRTRQLVLVGDPFHSQPYRQHYGRELATYANSFGVIDLAGQPWEEVQQRIANLRDDAVIVYTAIYKGGVVPALALKRLAQVANRPIVVDTDTLVGTGSIGGFVLNTDVVAGEIGQLALRILDGHATTDIPARVINAVRPVFDWRQLHRFAVEEGQLPAGSEIRFRETSLWEANSVIVLTVSTVVALQALFITWLMFEHRRRRRAEKESHRYMLELTQMDRTVTVGALSSSIAHELSQPLGAILSNADAAEMLLQEKAPPVDELKEILSDIRRDDQRAVEIMRRLGILLKKSELRAQDVDIKVVVDVVLKIIGPEARRRGIEVCDGRRNEPIVVRADPVHLQQIILNVAINAMEAMDGQPGKRRLTIRAVRLDEEEAMISVADTGPGIPEAEAEAIFRAHHSGKPQGTGLGLFIAHAIARTYGGRIWAENQPEGGAVFRLVLPLAHRVPRQEQTAQAELIL
jgi:signal transduction histidine kinase